MKSALLVVLAAALALTGCSSTTAESTFSKTYDISRVQRMAVVDGNNPTFKPEIRQALVDTFQYEFFKKGWNVIERGNIQKAIDELDFQNQNFTSQEDREKLGHILNVQALTVVNVQTVGDDLALTAKMFDVETGELIWIGNGEGNVNSNTSMITGAILGTAAGAVLGHNMGDNASVGAIAGAVVGGVAGRAMSESQVANAKEMIAKVCAELPMR